MHTIPFSPIPSLLTFSHPPSFSPFRGKPWHGERSSSPSFWISRGLREGNCLDRDSLVSTYLPTYSLCLLSTSIPDGVCAKSTIPRWVTVVVVETLPSLPTFSPFCPHSPARISPHPNTQKLLIHAKSKTGKCVQVTPNWPT